MLPRRAGSRTRSVRCCRASSACRAPRATCTCAARPSTARTASPKATCTTRNRTAGFAMRLPMLGIGHLEDDDLAVGGQAEPERLRARNQHGTAGPRADTPKELDLLALQGGTPAT